MSRLEALAGNPLISRRTSGTTGNWCFVHRAAGYPVFQGVSGWSASKTGADDLWVLPKPLLGVFPPWPPALRDSNPCFSHDHVFASSFRRFSVSGVSRVDATQTRTEDFRETSRLLSSLESVARNHRNRTT